jgi:hypothetical protein
LKERADISLRKWTTQKREHLQEDVASTALGRKRNGDAPLGYSGRTALRRKQCNVDDQNISRQRPVNNLQLRKCMQQ